MSQKSVTRSKCIFLIERRIFILLIECRLKRCICTINCFFFSLETLPDYRHFSESLQRHDIKKFIVEAKKADKDTKKYVFSISKDLLRILMNQNISIFYKVLIMSTIIVSKIIFKRKYLYTSLNRQFTK